MGTAPCTSAWLAVGLHDEHGEAGPCLICFLSSRIQRVLLQEMSDRFQIPAERLARGDDPPPWRRSGVIDSGPATLL